MTPREEKIKQLSDEINKQNFIMFMLELSNFLIMGVMLYVCMFAITILNQNGSIDDRWLLFITLAPIALTIAFTIAKKEAVDNKKLTTDEYTRIKNMSDYEYNIELINKHTTDNKE